MNHIIMKHSHFTILHTYQLIIKIKNTCVSVNNDYIRNNLIFFTKNTTTYVNSKRKNLSKYKISSKFLEPFPRYVKFIYI